MYFRFGTTASQGYRTPRFMETGCRNLLCQCPTKHVVAGEAALAGWSGGSATLAFPVRPDPPMVACDDRNRQMLACRRLPCCATYLKQGDCRDTKCDSFYQ